MRILFLYIVFRSPENDEVMLVKGYQDTCLRTFCSLLMPIMLLFHVIAVSLDISVKTTL